MEPSHEIIRRPATDKERRFLGDRRDVALDAAMGSSQYALAIPVLALLAYLFAGHRFVPASFQPCAIVVAIGACVAWVAIGMLRRWGDVRELGEEESAYSKSLRLGEVEEVRITNGRVMRMHHRGLAEHGRAWEEVVLAIEAGDGMVLVVTEDGFRHGPDSCNRYDRERVWPPWERLAEEDEPVPALWPHPLVEYDWQVASVCDVRLVRTQAPWKRITLRLEPVDTNPAICSTDYLPAGIGLASDYFVKGDLHDTSKLLANIEQASREGRTRSAQC